MSSPLRVSIQVTDKAGCLLHDEVREFTPRNNKAIATFHNTTQLHMQRKYLDWNRIEISEINEPNADPYAGSELTGSREA